MTRTTSSTTRVWPDQWPDFVGAWPRLTGRQVPEVEVWHPGDEAEGDLTAKFGVKIGLRCLPWEWMVIRAVMSELDENEFGERLWTHRNVVVECTRQQGKTLMLILIILRRLFKHNRRIVYTAQQWATVEDVFDRVVAVIERVPSLKDRLARPTSKKDNRGVILLKSGAKADFGPRTQHFARGFTEVDDLILDESYDLVPKEVANLTGAQAASSNPQTIYASTPPVASEHLNCQRFSGLIRTIENGGGPGLYGALYRAPKDMKRGDPEAYRLAQPSYGVVGDDREMEAHLQGAKDAGAADLALFDADWLGWGDYPPPENSRERLISVDRWDDMGPKSGRPRLAGSPAVGLHRESGVWTITAAQYTDTGQAHLEIGYSKAATAPEVVAAVVELVAAWNPCAVAVKGRGDAAALKAELIKAGVEPEMIDGGLWAQWCGGFLNAALSSKLSHSGQAELSDGVAAAAKKEMPAGGFVWDEDVAGRAAGALCSATLAHGALLAFGNQRKRKTKAPRTAATRITGSHHGAESDFDAMSAAF